MLIICRSFYSDLVVSCIKDELGPDSVVLWTAVVKEGVGEVSHALHTEAVPTTQEDRILQRHKVKQKGWKVLTQKSEILRTC